MSSFGRHKSTVVEPILEALYELLLNYPRLKNRINKTQILLNNLVKPESVKTLQFLL
ncbi:MAG: hypothetical protein QG562_116 [Patescibacteria group bacterium]|nr:hypothetical protein [Patescibacteria group bacterium]